MCELREDLEPERNSRLDLVDIVNLLCSQREQSQFEFKFAPLETNGNTFSSQKVREILSSFSLCRGKYLSFRLKHRVSSASTSTSKKISCLTGFKVQGIYHVNVSPDGPVDRPGDM